MCCSGIPSGLVQHFGVQSVAPASNSTTGNSNTRLPRPACVMLLSGENAWHHAVSLLEACMVYLQRRNILGTYGGPSLSLQRCSTICCKTLLLQVLNFHEHLVISERF
jgi:hypothetical protein